MPRRHFRGILAVFTLLAGFFTIGATPAMAAPLLPGLPAFSELSTLGSCAAIHKLVPLVPDGDYVLFTGKTLLGVYCYDMAGAPREYLNLADTGGDANFSQYTAGGASPGTNVRTSFTKLRIDPATLTVDINDLTFATSTGRLQHSSVTRGPQSPFVSTMPYGVGMSCTTLPDGTANIDLRGTPFTIADTFTVRAFAGSGSATLSADDQVADLKGGGYCGWISPAPTLETPFNPQGTDYRLELACTPFNPLNLNLLLRQQACLNLF